MLSIRTGVEPIRDQLIAASLKRRRSVVGTTPRLPIRDQLIAASLKPDNWIATWESALAIRDQLIAASLKRASLGRLIPRLALSAIN